MSKESSNEKIDLNSLTKKLCVEDLAPFESYLKDVWVDLYSRVNKNKNDPKEKAVKLKGLSKIIFNSYYTLPGIIGERLFNVFDTNSSGSIELDEFVEGMKTLFYEDYGKNTKFIFDFYDFDNDGKINKEDIKVILSYITLTYSEINEEKKTADKTNISFKHRVKSQEELNNILDVCFNDKHIKHEKIEFKDFRYIVENINSDIYLMIYLFLLQNKPFSNKNIEPYKNQIPGKESPSKKEKIMIASPTKGANFSPYKTFKRQSRSINLDKNKDLLKLIKMSPSKENEKEIKVPRKKNTSKISKGIIRFQPLGDDEKIAPSGFKNKKSEKELDYKRVDELTHVKKKKNIRDSDSPLKPAFKQTKKVVANPKKKEKKKDENNIQFVDNEEEDEKNEDDEEDDNSDKDSSNDSSFEDVEDLVEDEGIHCQGKLYKLVNNKLKELWFKLVYKDLFYYKNKNEKVHRGMHNLSGLFLQAQGVKEIKGKKLYCFNILFPSKNRIYYCDNETEYNNWISALKKATGYTNLLDLYDIKQKLGKGKFGLVKLGINKETNDKVAVKIMNKNNMDSSDLELVRTEIEILKICQHPYIIKLYDIFENVDYIYIIMEYCPGGDLFSYLQKRNFTLKEEKVAIIMYKLCKAVFYVHSYGIAHRDIKPENVLLTSEDEDADIRLLDFGLSKIVGPNQKCTEPYGTLTYCAPEIILDKPYLKTVDSWSLGVMTYLMLSGSLPFSGKDEHEIAKNVVYSKVNFEKKPIWKEISNEAKDFITKLLDKDLKTRIEMKTALEHPWFKLFNLKNTIDEKKFYVK
jgi:Ca2+-binding EF-hand superfamily protein